MWCTLLLMTSRLFLSALVLLFVAACGTELATGAEDDGDDGATGTDDGPEVGEYPDMSLDHDNADAPIAGNRLASEPSDSYCPTRSLGCPCDVLGDCAYSLTCMDGLCGVCVDGNPGCACDAAGKCDLDLWCTSSGICEFID